MKKIKIFTFMSLILFLGFNNPIYAATQSAAQKETSNSGKMILVGVGFVLVSLVLFIGYKLDKSESETDINKKNKKKQKKYEEDDVYSPIDEDSIKYEEEKNENYEKEINEIEYNEEDDESLYSSFDENDDIDDFDDIYENNDSEDYNNDIKTDFNDIVEKNDLKELAISNRK